MAILDGLRNGYPQYFTVQPSTGLDPNILVGAAQMMRAGRVGETSSGTKATKGPLDETMPQMTKATGERYIDRLYKTEAKRKSVYNKALNDKMEGKDPYQISEEYKNGMTEVTLEEADNMKFRNQAINQNASLKAFQGQAQDDKTGGLIALINGRPVDIAYDKEGKEIEAFVQKKDDEGRLAFNEDRTRNMIVNPNLGAFMTMNQYYDYVNGLDNFDEKGMPNNIPLPTLYDPNLADEKSYQRVKDWANKNNSTSISTTGGVPSVNEDGTINETDPMGGSVRTNFEQITSGILNSPSMVMGSQTELNSALGNYWKAVERGEKIAIPNTEFEKSPEFTDLASAVMHIESRGRAKAVSSVGAVGTMQTMPDTLKNPGYGVKPAVDNSPAELERVGKDYLQAMLKKYDGNVDHALAAYNAGPAYVDAWLKPEGEKTTVTNHKGEKVVILGTGGDISKLYPETRKYIPAVKERLADSEDKTRAAVAPVIAKDIYEAGFPQWVASRATGMSMPLQEKHTTETFKNPSVSKTRSALTEENYREVVSNFTSFKVFDRNPTLVNFVDTQVPFTEGSKFNGSPDISVKTYNLLAPPPGVRTQMERTLQITGNEKTIEEFPNVLSNKHVANGGTIATGQTLDLSKYTTARIVSYDGDSWMPIKVRDLNRKETQELESNRDDKGNVLLRSRMTAEGESEMVKDVLSGPKIKLTVAMSGDEIARKGIPALVVDEDANDKEVQSTMPKEVQALWYDLKRLTELKKMHQNWMNFPEGQSDEYGDSIDKSIKEKQDGLDAWRKKEGITKKIANNWKVKNITTNPGPLNTLLREVIMKDGVKTYGDYASSDNHIDKDKWYEFDYYVDSESTQGFDIGSTKQNAIRQFATSDRLRGVPQSVIEGDSIANDFRNTILSTAVQPVTQDSTTTR